jgi:hypothetical protein
LFPLADAVEDLIGEGDVAPDGDAVGICVCSHLFIRVQGSGFRVQGSGFRILMGE